MSDNNGDMPAMPLDMEGNKALDEGYWYSGWGLTKREHFAAMAMQGFTSAGSSGMPPPDVLAGYAVEQADALLAALENKS